MDNQQPLRQPLTFWQWLTGQPGTLFVPPAPKPQALPLTPVLQVIDNELARLHKEMDSFNVTDGPGYLKLIDSLNILNQELVRRSMEESNNEAIFTR